MSVITIREQQQTETGFAAILSFDGRGNYPITITNPFTPKDEKQLEWYFEDWLVYPMLDTETAQRVAASITIYGEKLFEQVFQSNLDAYSDYRQLQGNLRQIQIEIESQTPEFQSLHWEAMRDRNLPRPLAVDCVMVRKLTKSSSVPANVKPSPVINLLVVVARPDEEDDVGYRTISRPLIEAIDRSQLPVNVELLRPGTYEALCRHLEAKEQGYYHIIHFDVHGALMSYEEFNKGVKKNRYLYQRGYGLENIHPYDGEKAFLFLEGDNKGKAVPVEATELANLLTGRGIPVCILNACQSGKQVSAGEEDYRETSLGSQLMAAGMQAVVAMGYSVTVSAAKLMMQQLYQHLFDRKPFVEAIRLSRCELFNEKQRKAYFNQTINLEDWLLPVVYSNQSVNLNLREFIPEEEEQYYESIATQYRFPLPTYGFIGRDLEILKIEKALLKHNILLLRGMGGTGKTTLLNYLREWWQRTHYAEQIFYFGYDEKTWTLEQILFEISKQVYEKFDRAKFQAMNQQAQIQKLVQKLRSESHILILDNLESIAGQQLAIQNTLPEEEKNKLKNFLERLAAGKTKVVLGSRSGEEWLQARTFKQNIYHLQGLDKESRTDLAEEILKQIIGEKKKIERIKADDDFKRLMELLAGYPLAMEVVLANLNRHTPQDILENLHAADISLDTRSEKRTESIVGCVEYSYRNLSSEAQKLLLCLAPFSNFILKAFIPNYVEQLQTLEPFQNYPFEQFYEAIQEAINWGLLSPNKEKEPDFLTIHPVFPYCLKTKVNQLDKATQSGLKIGFKNHYLSLAYGYKILMESNNAQQRQWGIIFCCCEYENLFNALQIYLEKQETVFIFFCLYKYFNLTSDISSNLKLSEYVYQARESYSDEIRKGEIELEIILVLNCLADCYRNTKNYQQAKKYYQKAVKLTQKLSDVEEKQKYSKLASTYHNLGVVAEELREWDSARGYYQQALDICLEYGDRDSQVLTYYHLGRVAQELREWKKAWGYYQQASEIFIEYGDRFSQAGIYHQLGMVAQELRKSNSARSYYQQALEIFIEHSDRFSQAKTYHQLGMLAQELQEWESARGYYQQALKIFIEYSNRYFQAGTYFNLGRVAQKLREWDSARQNYQQALEILEYSDRFSQARIYHQLGMVAQELQEWESARGYYQQALENYIEYSDRNSQAGTYYNLGRVAQELQEWEEAKADYLKALQIWAEFNEQYNLETFSLPRLAHFYQTTRDESLITAAASILKTTVEELKERLSQFL